MYIRKITFTDYNGLEHTRPYYFNLSKSELLRLQLSIGGGLTEYAKRLMDAEDMVHLSELFEKLILMSYGEKTDDGMHFIKEDENGKKLSSMFKQTAAYDELYTELCTNEQSAIEFFNAVIPAEAANQQPTVTEGHAYPPSAAK